MINAAKAGRSAVATHAEAAALPTYLPTFVASCAAGRFRADGFSNSVSTPGPLYAPRGARMRLAPGNRPQRRRDRGEKTLLLQEEQGPDKILESLRSPRLCGSLPQGTIRRPQIDAREGKKGAVTMIKQIRSCRPRASPAA